MPNKDSCHEQVVRALRKDGWFASQQLKYIRTPDFYIFVDLKLAKGERQIYVEVKCFPGHNDTQELYIAFGQYLVYRSFLTRRSQSIPLYLAVPKEVFDNFASTVVDTIRDNRVRIAVVDLETEVVVQWIE